MRRDCVVFLFGLSLVPAAIARGDDAALVAEALARNPEVAAARAAVDSAARGPEQARALPDPMLDLSYVNDGVRPSLGTQMMTTLGLMVRQELVRPGLRRARGAEAETRHALAERQLERTLLTVEADVRRALVALRRAEQGLAVLRELEPLWGQIEASVQVRYEVGRAAQTDLLRARLERLRLRESLLEAAAEAQIARAEVNRLRDRPLETTVPVEPLALRPIARPLEELLAEGERLSPELRAASVEEERGRLGLVLARSEGGTDLAVQAGYMNRGGLDPMWQVGLSARLPLRRARVQAGVAGAEAARQAAAARREAVRLELRQRTAERMVRLEAAAQVVALYDESILPEGAIAVLSARAGYESGGVPLSAVLETLAAVARDRLSRLDRVAAHERLRASLFEWSLDADPPMPAAMPRSTMPAAGMTATAPMTSSAGSGPPVGASAPGATKDGGM